MKLIGGPSTDRPDLRPSTYARAFFSDWLAGMSGPVSVPFAALAVLSPNPNHKLLWSLLALASLLFASYRVWMRERLSNFSHYDTTLRELADERGASKLISEWKDLASRFERITPSIRIDWQQGGWHFTGQRVGNVWYPRSGPRSDECEALGRLAGKMLLRTAKTRSGLRSHIIQEQDDFYRWLTFLRDLGAGLVQSEPVPNTSPSGEVSLITSGYIKDVASASHSACLHVAATEMLLANSAGK